MKNPYEILNFIRIFVRFRTNKASIKPMVMIKKNWNEIGPVVF